MLKNYVGAHLRLVNHWKGKKKRELYIYIFFFLMKYKNVQNISIIGSSRLLNLWSWHDFLFLFFHSNFPMTDGQSSNLSDDYQLLCECDHLIISRPGAQKHKMDHILIVF